MMKKRVLTGTLVAVMALSAMTTGLSFADETVTTDENKIGRAGIEKMQGGRQGGMNKEGRGEENAEDRQATKEEREAEMQALIDEHYPEISDEWNELKTDIETAQEEIRELVQPEDGERPERPEGGRGLGFSTDGERPDFENMTDEEIEAYKAEMFETIQERMSGEKPEGQKPAKGGKGLGFGPEGEKPDFENMTDEEIEAYKAEKEAERAERQAEREAFETAVEEGDSDTIIEHLDNMLDKMEEHLENIEAKLAELQEDAE